MKILLIDDEPLELEQLFYLINKRHPDWEVFCAEDGAEAKRLIQKHQFPLAFVDIQLPGSSGLEFAGFAKDAGMRMEIVLITAYQNFEYAKQALRLGLMDYLVKPVIEEELYNVIDKFLSVYRPSETKSDIINEAIMYIKNNFNKKVSLNSAAEAVHVTPAYLSRKFTEELGIHFKEYLIRYRVEQAKSVMRQNPEWSIQKVAELTGFASQHHFSNSFKKYVHVTPTQFKEKV